MFINRSNRRHIKTINVSTFTWSSVGWRSIYEKYKGELGDRFDKKTKCDVTKLGLIGVEQLKLNNSWLKRKLLLTMRLFKILFSSPNENLL